MEISRKQVQVLIATTAPAGEAPLEYSLRVLHPLYPDLTAESPAELQLKLRALGWRKTEAKPAAYWNDAYDECGFVEKLYLGGVEFFSSNGRGRRQRLSVAGKLFCSLPG